jgi:hypothetical protein
MTGWTVASPLGYTQQLWSAPFPEFGVFLLKKLPAGTAVNVSPEMATLRAGEKQQIVATVAGNTNKGVTWSISPALGSVSSAGLYTAPASVASKTIVTVTATSAADPTKTASSSIRLLPNITVSLNPSTVLLGPGSTQLFIPVVTGTPDSNVIWSMNPSTLGTLSTTGRYTAPTAVKTQQSITITATSAVDTNKSDSVVVTLAPGVAVITTPPSATVQPRGTAQYTAKVTGTTNQAVTWSLSPSVGTISSSGLYTAPASVSSTTEVIVRATSVADSSRYSTSLLTISGPAGVTVSINPPSTTLQQGGSAQFTAQVGGAPNTAVTWSLSPAVGSISSTGLYAAPNSITSQTTVTVTATSVADPTKSSSATVTLTPPVSVVLTPGSASLPPNGTLQFSVQVSTSSNTAVTWSLSPALGSISSTGLYTAPASFPTSSGVTGTASSVADPTKSSSATVTLTPPVSVVLTPGSASLPPNGTLQVAVRVYSSSNSAVAGSLAPGRGGVSGWGR